MHPMRLMRCPMHLLQHSMQHMHPMRPVQVFYRLARYADELYKSLVAQVRMRVPPHPGCEGKFRVQLT